jgi:hypothetical protein
MGNMTHLTDQILQDYIFSDSPYLHPKDQAHLLVCGDCKARLETYSMIHQHLKQTESPALQPRVYESISSRLIPVSKPKFSLPWYIPLTTFIVGLLLFFLPKIDFGYELPVQLSLGIAAAAVVIIIEIKYLETVYKQKIKQVH